MYADGKGAIQDFVTGYAWLNLAAAQGNEIALEGRKNVLKEMSPGQIEEAQKLSKELQEKIYNQPRN
jgi:TPR repeat protein